MAHAAPLALSCYTPCGVARSKEECYRRAATWGVATIGRRGPPLTFHIKPCCCRHPLLSQAMHDAASLYAVAEQVAGDDPLAEPLPQPLLV